MGFWDLYDRIYGKLVGWKPASYFCEEGQQLVTNATASLDSRRGLLGSRSEFEELVRTNYDHLVKLRNTPILCHEVDKTPDTIIVGDRLRRNWQRQLQLLDSNGIDWERIGELMTEEQGLLAEYGEKVTTS